MTLYDSVNPYFYLSITPKICIGFIGRRVEKRNYVTKRGFAKISSHKIRKTRVTKKKSNSKLNMANKI